ncbi:MAG: hypothetical protein ACI4OT_04890 [Bacilli bacterium]
MEFFTDESRNYIMNYILYITGIDDDQVNNLMDDELVFLFLEFIKLRQKEIRKNTLRHFYTLLSYHVLGFSPLYREMESFYDLGYKGQKEIYKTIKKDIKKLCRDVNDNTIDNLTNSTILSFHFESNYYEGSKKIKENLELEDPKLFVASNEFDNMINDSMKLLELKKRR